MKKLSIILSLLAILMMNPKSAAPQDDPYDPHPEEMTCDNTFMPATPEHACQCEKTAYCPPQNVPGTTPDAPPTHMPNCRHYCRADKCKCSGMCES